MKLLAAKPGDKGEIEIEEEPLGKGGEGAVHSVITHSLSTLPNADDLVVKLYYEPEAENRPQKIRSMILAPPDSDSVAWPLAAVQKNGKFAGYMMTKLDYNKFRPWADLAHSQTRRKTAKDFDVLYAMTAIRNFAVAIEAVHDEGHRIGDINESNMFVGSDARVFLVDTDSAQIRDPKQDKIYPCLVGKPEYTAAEISHGSLKDHKRTEETDVFGFAVAAYQMLLGGPHPADAVFNHPDPDVDPPKTIEKIRSGSFPALSSKTDPSQNLVAPPRVAISGVPLVIQKALLTSLSPDPANRLSLSTLVDTFDNTSDQMVQCSTVKQHWYDQRDGACGWCAHAEKTQIDPWVPEQQSPSTHSSPKKKASQKSLSGLNFNNNDSPKGPAKRLPPQVAGANNSLHNPASYNPQQPGGPHHTPPPGQPPNYATGYHQPPGPYPYPHPYGPGYPQQQPQQYQPPTQKELQKRFKTRKTVLKYTDGSYSPRPPIGQLMRSKPKMAFSCLRDETPDFATFWWTKTRNVAKPWALVIGYVIALALAVIWWFNFPEWLTMLAEWQEWNWVWIEYVWLTFAYIGSVGTVITSTWLTLSGLLDRKKEKKQNGTLANMKEEKWYTTSLRYLSVSIIYGPILAIGSVIALMVLTLNILLAMISAFANDRN